MVSLVKIFRGGFELSIVEVLTENIYCIWFLGHIKSEGLFAMEKLFLIKAVFLDRDGTIVEEPSGPGVGDDIIASVEQLNFLPNAIKGLRKIVRMGYHLFVVSNQPGINRGQLTLDQYKSLNGVLVDALTKAGVVVEKWLVCPHLPEENCDCRKPKTGMVDSIKNQYSVDFKNSYLIGDRNSDLLLAKNLGTKSILVKRNEKNFVETGKKPDFKAKNLLDACQFIVNLNQSNVT